MFPTLLLPLRRVVRRVLSSALSSAAVLLIQPRKRSRRRGGDCIEDKQSEQTHTRAPGTLRRTWDAANGALKKNAMCMRVMQKDLGKVRSSVDVS